MSILDLHSRYKINPFGLWPDRTSVIVNHGTTAISDDPTYVFHSDYVTTQAGQATFSGHFHGLSATSGELSITVRAMPYNSQQSMRVKRVTLPLAKIAADGGHWRIMFPARRGCYHAVVGRTADGTDAVATQLELGLDGWGDGKQHSTTMLHARRRVFGRGSRVGAGLWRRRSPVDVAGLISTVPATIADPTSQMCTATQMAEPAYAEWLKRLGMGVHRHRKQWEMVYILAVLEAAGMLRPNMRGLGFGCGGEAIPSYLAARGCSVVATDMPTDHQELSGWITTGQHSSELEQLHWPSLCGIDAFREHVAFRAVNMTAVPADIVNFDFCWSACAFEHLGSIAAGLRFIHDAVACLRPGGIAVHTTELNLSSDGATVDNDSTVLFRRRDMERLALDLTKAGHCVLPLKYDPGHHLMDDHVDVPPYSDTEHLKIALRQFVTTSFGIAVIRAE